jgi:hypothetical protein
LAFRTDESVTDDLAVKRFHDDAQAVLRHSFIDRVAILLFGGEGEAIYLLDAVEIGDAHRSNHLGSAPFDKSG